MVKEYQGGGSDREDQMQISPGGATGHLHEWGTPAMQETWVWNLGQEDPLKKEMTIHSSVLAWRIPGTGEPGGLPSMGLHRVGHD